MVTQFSKYFTEQSILSPTNTQCHLLVLRVLCMHVSVLGSVFCTVCLLCHYDCLTESSIILFVWAAGRAFLLCSSSGTLTYSTPLLIHINFRINLSSCVHTKHTPTPAHTQMHAHIYISVEIFIGITRNAEIGLGRTDIIAILSLLIHEYSRALHYLDFV